MALFGCASFFVADRLFAQFLGLFSSPWYESNVRLSTQHIDDSHKALPVDSSITIFIKWDTEDLLITHSKGRRAGCVSNKCIP